MSAAESVRNKLKNNKPLRYRAGIVPVYARDTNEQSSNNQFEGSVTLRTNNSNTNVFNINVNRNNNSNKDINNDDLKRDTRNNNQSNEEKVTEHVRRRVVRTTEVISSGGDQDDVKHTPTTNTAFKDNEDSQDEDVDDRRRRARERYLQREKQEQEDAKNALNKFGGGDDDEEEEDDEDEDESEEEESSEEEEEEDSWGKPTFRPVFVKKELRNTVKTNEMYEKEEQEQLIRQEREKEQRKLEAHKKLKDELDRDKKEQEALKQMMMEDGGEEEEEEGGEEHEKKVYEAWVVRETARLIEELKIEIEQELIDAEKERRSKMTDKEIEMEDADRLKREPKQKLKFLQKDYHRGAFFQDDEYIKNKDFSAPTERERINYELLPKIMQTKNFGKSGRSKYTHLTDQDTSSRDSLWSQNKQLEKKYYDKVATNK